MIYMIRFSKILSLILSFIITALLFIVPAFSADTRVSSYASIKDGAGCVMASSSPKEEDGRMIVSCIKTAENGLTYLEVDGKPFPYFGVESRLDAYMNCENKSVEDFEPHIKAASELGANVIAVPIDWRDLEPVQDNYDFRIISALLRLANKYDIKIEFCWYSVNMCGDSNSYQIPEYIWNDEKTYPKYDSNNKNAFWGYYGNQGYLRASKALMDRETKMITALMDFVCDWDENNGQKHPLIGVQVYNEPDGFPRWRVSQQNISSNGSQISESDAWEDVFALIDNAGKAFKAAKYNVYTRTNLTVLTEVTDFAEKLYELEGIDAVGNDPYVQSVGDLYHTLSDFKCNLKGNFNHIAENKGVYVNTPGLLITSAFCGAGYIIYDLATPQYFIDNTNDPSAIDHGILNTDLSDKQHTDAVRKTLKALTAAGDALIFADRSDFAVFNLEGSFPDENYTRSVKTSRVRTEFSTEQGAVGFAVYHNGYVYAYASENAALSIGNAVCDKAEYGGYGENGWNGAGNVRTENGKYLLEGGRLCRIKIDKTYIPLISNVKKYIGERGKSTICDTFENIISTIKDFFARFLNALTGGYWAIQPSDLKSADAHREGDYIIINLYPKEQTDGPNGDEHEGTVGHVVNVVQGIDDFPHDNRMEMLVSRRLMSRNR